MKTTRLSIVLCLLFATGCTGYGKVSPAAYDYSMAIYSLSNRKSAERIDAVQAQINQDLEAGKLTEREADWLGGMLTDARGGEWDAAASSARRMMSDQVER